MGGGPRSSRTACTCGEGRLTRHSSACCRGTGSRDPAQTRSRGWALQQPTARRHRTYPELLGTGRVRCRLVVLGMEVGGRINSGASAFLRRLARARARATRRALHNGWRSLLSPACERAPARYWNSPAMHIHSSDGTEMPLGDLLAGAAGDEPIRDNRVR